MEDTSLDFCRLLISIKTPEDCDAFCRVFLSPRELQNLRTRLLLFRFLNEGLSQRDVASKCDVSIATVSRAMRILNDEQEFYSKIEKIMNQTNT